MGEGVGQEGQGAREVQARVLNQMAQRAGGSGYSSGRLTAPMPGQVRAINVAVGEAVTKGKTLLVLEAMKMEIRIQAPSDGVVERLAVEQGETVEREQVLIEIGDSDNDA